MNEEISGQWSGLMYDIEGYRARLEMTLEESQGSLRGSVQVGLIESHDVREQRGEAVGKISDKGEVTLEYQVETAPQETMVRFTGRLFPVQQHAKAALYGTYEVRTPREETLSGGVAILWKYGK